jgi:hypothetical protein
MSIFILIEYDAGFAGTAFIASPYSLQLPTFATATWCWTCEAAQFTATASRADGKVLRALVSAKNSAAIGACRQASHK